MKDNTPTPNKEKSGPPPACPFCQGEVIYPEFKEGCPPEPPKCSKCGKFIPPPGEFHPFFAGFGFDFYNDPNNFGPRHHRRGISPPKCKNCDTLYPPLEFKSGEPIKMPKCSFCETEMEPPKYLPRCKNCDTLYPFPIYKPGEPPIMPKCSFCETEMEPPKGPKCQKCGAPIPRLTREERHERMELYKSGKNPEPRRCKQCGEELKRPLLPFFRRPHRPHGPHGHHGPHGPHGPHWPHGPHGPHGMFGFPHHHFGWGMGWRFGWGNWMQNQGFVPKVKDEKEDKNKMMNDNQNVYNYYGCHYFNPWFKKFDQNQNNEVPKPKEEKNEINNQNPQMNYQMGGGYEYPSQYQQQYDPWGIGYGGFGYGYGFPPYGFNHPHGGYGQGNEQPPNQPAPPQNEPQQQEQGEGERYFDMPFYDPYFGYNYQFGQNQGGNNDTKKP